MEFRIKIKRYNNGMPNIIHKLSQVFLESWVFGDTSLRLNMTVEDILYGQKHICFNIAPFVDLVKRVLKSL